MQTEFRSLYEITGKITDHNMFVVPATELKTLTLFKKLAEEWLSIFPDLEALSAERETLCTGLAEARMEIESLKAQLYAGKQIIAAQSGRLAAYISDSALPGK